MNGTMLCCCVKSVISIVVHSGAWMHHYSQIVGVVRRQNDHSSSKIIFFARQIASKWFDRSFVVSEWCACRGSRLLDISSNHSANRRDFVVDRLSVSRHRGSCPESGLSCPPAVSRWRPSVQRTFCHGYTVYCHFTATYFVNCSLLTGK